jgi:hypothetical protein
MFHIDRLLEDARILWATASSRGLVDGDAFGASMVEAANKIRNGSFTVEDEHTLNRLVNDLAKRVRPENIAGLRGRHGKIRIKTIALRYLRAAQIYFSPAYILPSISIVLILVVIGLTSNFTQLTSLITEMKNLEKEHYWDKLEQAEHAYKIVGERQRSE